MYNVILIHIGAIIVTVEKQ